MRFLRQAVVTASLSTCLVSLIVAAPAAAQDANSSNQVHVYHLPAQSLAASLRAVAVTTGTSIAAPAQVVGGRQAPELSGAFTPEAALAALLAGSGLHARPAGNGLIIEADAFASGHTAAGEQDSEILVTGSRIRGAPVASPVIVVDHQAMEEHGQTTLGDVMRSLPQDFGGGQNPGVATTVPAASGINVAGASTANLRGLGSDATLTLLNGHRLAYNGSRQGIDLSSIPFGMVDRLEVVADGASALYGSDAVAGVVNVILKRDYEGMQVSANLGQATDGGDVQQQYGVVTGHKWSSGGIVAAYEFSENTNVFSTQRSFTADRPGIIIYPAMHHHAAALSMHQALTDTLTFEMDATYNKRWSTTGATLSADGSWDKTHYDTLGSSRSGAIAPSLKLQLGPDWHLALSGVYGTETVQYRQNLYVGSTLTTAASACYCNQGKSVELAADGRLFDLPGGPVKLATGAGYRINSMNYFTVQNGPYNFNGSQSSTYAYGEVSVPVVSSVQGIAAIDHLSLSGALRYERYPGIGSVATPKLGIIYAPVADVSIKGSWGRSFRAPTLYQQHQGLATGVYTAASRGGTGYASTATVLYVGGGNVNLKPERAESWAATMDYAPHQLPGLRLQASYFSTIYKDRIVTPITYSTLALSTASYGPWVNLAPTSAEIASAVASTASFTNYAGGTYNPSSVVAIIDNSNFNAGRQVIHGIDMLVDYKTSLGQHAGHLGLSANAAYLVSRQQLIAGAATTQLAGTLFNPPHWRGNASLSWGKDGLTVNTVTTVIGGVTDVRAAIPIRQGGMVTQDVTARYAFGEATGPLHGLTLSLTVQNLLNDRPPVIATTLYYETSFDSTNYSPIGRYVGMGVTKSW